ncbi:Clp protease ClpP [Virgibacillus sp. C22-A2]|uniref:ATP-dependent Clp protease proteolytic subunit n=1 Tax=Virgibacillus tibetensis TaxID=3042313 RepID=A0ABU6KBB6_9BACI|nr:Clp protease ClpP [Virgibacillus sp. C22-A2]
MTVKIDIKGPIISNNEAWIYDLFDMDATNPRKVDQALENANGEDVIVSINSPGGYVDDGSEIYTALKNYPGYVEAQIVGLAASAASFIAMGADKVRIAPTAQMMIHNASTIGIGDHRDMTKTADMLKTTDRTIVNAYMIKSGMLDEELLNMMAEETWLGPQEALDKKLVDEIMFVENGMKLAASYNGSNMIPQQVINTIRNKAPKAGVTSNEPPKFITEDFLKSMLNDFKDELKSELQQKNNNESNEPKSSAPTQTKRKGFIF